MKNILLFIFFVLVAQVSFAQPQDARQLQETAKTFTRQGDYANAILVLNRAYQQEPENFAIGKDLALNYYLQKENNKALEIIKPLLDHDDADDQIFQIAGNIYKALNLPKECEKLYRKGIKKFPKSGSLYSEFGELLWAQGSLDAIKQWEKGIEADPDYGGNYYHAAKYYYFTTDKVWSIIYGEIFLNIETGSSRTAEMKGVLLESYKKLFTRPDLLKENKDKRGFVLAYLKSMDKQSEITSAGLNPETLTMIRTRFILDWYETAAKKYAFRLFDYHQQLLREGLFEAYNQWIFGVAQNLVAYQRWTTTHSEEYNEFSRFQKGRTFHIPEGQHYQDAK